MPDAFEIIVPTTEVGLSADRTGTVTADITCRLNRNTRVGVEVLPGEGVDPLWIASPDPEEYDGQIGETRQVRIPIAVPADAPAGSATFQVRAYAIDNPSEDYTASSSVPFKIPEMEDGGIPTWLIAVIAAVVVIVIGGIAWVFFGPDDDTVAVPALVGKTTNDATSDAGDVDVQLLSGNDAAVEGELCVLFQYPPAGSEDEPVEMKDDSSIAALTVPCPTSLALSPQTLNITTEIILDGVDTEEVDPGAYANVCEVGEGDDFCDAVAADPVLEEQEVDPDEFLESVDFKEILRDQEERFRTEFSERVVPDLTGKTESQAQALLEIVGGLTLNITETLVPETSPPTPGGGFTLGVIQCDKVLTQDPDPGTDPDQVEDGVVDVVMRRSLCPLLITEIFEAELKFEAVDG